jgi:AraC-like DNA-binding protein
MDSIDVAIIPAPEYLRPFVRRYLYVNRPLETPLIIRPKPTGYLYFVNQFGKLGTDFVVVDGHKSSLDSRWHFAGQIVDHDITRHVFERHEALYCELSATALHRLFGVPGERITGEAPPLSKIRPDLESLACRHFVVGTAGAREVHIEEANTFFLALVERAGPGDALVEDAVALFEARNGAVHVAEICEELGADPRQLNRRFNHVVGVSPKFFAQILQINWVVGLLFFDDTATLTEMAHEAGFHDQSHFNRAMKRFFSEGPREFLASEHVLFKEFLGASRRFGPTSPGQSDIRRLREP